MRRSWDGEQRQLQTGSLNAHDLPAPDVRTSQRDLAEGSKADYQKLGPLWAALVKVCANESNERDRARVVVVQMFCAVVVVQLFCNLILRIVSVKFDSVADAAEIESLGSRRSSNSGIWLRSCVQPTASTVRILGLLKSMDGEHTRFGFQVNGFEHSLQTATRSYTARTSCTHYVVLTAYPAHCSGHFVMALTRRQSWWCCCMM